VEIREASLNDAARIAAIYNDEVMEGTRNYETQLHTEVHRREWLERLRHQNYPVLVGIKESIVAGFAAITPFHPVSGYRATGTGSIYVAKEFRRSCVGRGLGEAMLNEARKRNIHTLIGGVNAENTASLALLESFGFQRVGYFKEIAYKNGKWHDDVCLQLIL